MSGPGEDEAYDVYVFDVFATRHNDVMAGRLVRRHSRVSCRGRSSRRFADADEVAANLATAVHGGIPTAVHPRW